MVKGLVNWDRVERYRRKWEKSGAEDGERRSWQEEFRVLAGRKELYQDRLVIISSGPYSAVEAGAIGMDDDEWLQRSIVLRRAHESFHYMTLRVFGTMRNAPIDEVLADMVGLAEAFGAYRPDLALRFFGLEDFPEYRRGGRLENYLVDPALSEGARRIERVVVKAAVDNLGTVWTKYGGSAEEAVSVFCSLSLEELAASDLGARFAERRVDV
jgi:hypothetical protein